MIKKKILLSTVIIAVLFSACTDDTKEEDKVIKKTESEHVIDKVADSVITGVEVTAKKAEEIAVSVQKSTSPMVKKVTEKIKNVQKEISETSMEDAKQKIVEVSAPIIKTVTAVVSTPDASVLYQKCASCHGANAQKKALNKSDIIQNWDSSKIVNALTGYQNGTYGGAMKGLMKAQTANLSQQDIEALANYIPTLK